MSNKGAPKYVLDRLINDGSMTRDRITRKPQRRTCRRCARPTLAAIDLDGFETWLDVGWLDPLGELTVLTHGGQTYRIEWSGGMRWRDHHDIKNHPANETVHPQHKCEQLWPVKYSQKEKRPRIDYDNDPIPF